MNTAIILGLIIVGGLAAFSIYLQQDEAIIELHKAVDPNYHCLEDHEYIMSMPKGSPQFIKNIEKVQAASSKFWSHDYCQYSFRDWMPQDHPSWDQFIVGENNRKDGCRNYLDGTIVYKQSEIDNFKLWTCKDFLKQFD